MSTATVIIMIDHHVGNVCSLLFDFGRRFHLVERLTHGVKQQFVLGQMLPGFDNQIN